MTPKQTKKIDVLKTDMPSAVKLFSDVYASKASPRKCIKAFCLECQGLDRVAITHCTADSCPLWMERPYQGSEDAE